METFTDIITQISNYYDDLERLQTEYTKLLEAYIHKSKVKQAKKNYKRRTTTKNSTKNNTKNNNFHSSNLGSTSKTTFNNSKNIHNSEQTNQQKTENSEEKQKIPQQQRRQQQRNQKYKNLDDAKQWDSYNFFEPGKTTDNLEKRTLKRKRPQTTLRKILKKIYYRLLLKLHPDRSPLENSETICKRLVKSYKDNDYFYIFYMFEKIDCKIRLNDCELELLIPFLRDELQRIVVTLKLLNENINKFKN